MDIKYDFVKSPNFTPVDKKLIIIHWIVGTAESAIRRFANPTKKLSAHYVVSKTGKVTKMVEEQDIAWHAGISSLKGYPTDWNGQEWQSVNPCSIGIELEGPPSYVQDMDCWTEKLLQAAANLCRDIGTRHKGIRITDHSTVSPGRKIDVKGKTKHEIDLFPWKRFIKMTGLREA